MCNFTLKTFSCPTCFDLSQVVIMETIHQSKCMKHDVQQNSFYFFTNLIHLVFYSLWLFVSLSLHVSDQSVHHQEDQMLNYTSSFWRRSLGR